MCEHQDGGGDLRLHEVTIVGLGPGSTRAITLEALEALRSSSRLFLRTRHHPVVRLLEDEGIPFSTFDELYDRAADFDEVYEGIKEELLRAAVDDPVVYAVPGNPLVGERSVRLVISELQGMGISPKLIVGASGLDELFRVLCLDPCEKGVQVYDALSLRESLNRIDVFTPLIILQVYSRLVASEAKLELMTRYPAEHELTVIRAAGMEDERTSEVRLYEMDRLDWFDHLTSVYVPPVAAANEAEGREGVDPYGFGGLVDIVRRLRGENGCPWDKQQTHETLKPFVLEEAYEVVEALSLLDMHKLREELGDLLLQVVLQAVIAEEESRFHLRDVVAGISEKLVRRHPHVFGEVRVDDTADVLRNWELIKLGEKGDGGKSLLDDIPRSLPALMLAFKVQEKVSRVGFDWDDVRDILSKVREETRELEIALDKGDKGRVENELGDLLFAVVNLARFVRVEPETALGEAISRFIRRFNYIERNAAKNGAKLDSLSLEEMNRLWEEAKAREGG